MPESKVARLPLPSKERLDELIRYDPGTGVFTRKRDSVGRGRGKAGDILGTPSSGYLIIRFDKVNYLLHRLAFKIMTGEDPQNGKDIDHIDGDRGNNKWSNLRLVSSTDNRRNVQRSKANRSGVTGVCWAGDKNKWCAYIMVARKKIHLGYFTCLQEAIIARKAAEKFYGFHSGHDKRPRQLSEMSNPKTVVPYACIGYELKP